MGEVVEDAGWDWCPPGEPITGKTYRADGWVYRDLPRMAPEQLDQLVAIIGDDNIVWLSKADYGSSKRGQLLISPAGMQSLSAHNGARQ